MARFLTGIPLALVTTGLEARISEMGPEVSAREAAGFVVEGHGDLRPEHVCLTDPLVIFDRVETALELRMIDVFDEVGYLATECTLLGRPDLGNCLMRGALMQASHRPRPNFRRPMPCSASSRGRGWRWIICVIPLHLPLKNGPHVRGAT